VHGKVEERFKGAKDVVCFHLQTVWEGQHVNIPEASGRIAKQFRVGVPIGYDAHVDGARLSIFMTQYATGGTPWTIVIDRTGKVVFNAVTPKDATQLIALVERLRKAGATPRDG
jgi:hypothetical protein